ncbi:YheC/YheD family protein [Paenibacillus methanolicus]|uniref:YheC/D-like protein n=1 Tax=Paenibacillus methanolicus TaxID=582686 RepID=A0A5S5CAG6_9BACL|nr:YheC/YheD family protein [Paenibacillus methanolicus]TYP75330.1 YheC/D-like protein [Paenibacillus methanolicus]
MAIQRVRSKWAKTSVLLRSPLLAPRIPDTKLWSADTLATMLDQYGMVYVKPDGGTFGKGVMRVWKAGEGEYSFQSGTVAHALTSVSSLVEQLESIIGGRGYLIQRGISLLQLEGRSFDLRVMVQRNGANRWETTGMIGRLAQANKIVTNYHSGGTLTEVSVLLRPYLDLESQQQLYEQLRQLGTDTANQLSAAYPGLKEIGLDVALDDQFRFWVLEVNTKPDPYIFRALKDPAVFRKIYRYAVRYGRIKRPKKRRAAK